VNELESRAVGNRVPVINLAVGILTLISPWVLRPPSSTALWDVTATGIAIGVVALVTMSATNRQNWPLVNVLLGIWLLVSLVFIGNQMAMLWSNIVLGVLAIVTGLVSQSYEPVTHHRAVRT
jgi:hypothetical protein